MLMMVLCDREGRVYDVWITFGSVHEVRAFRERKKRSLWFRGLVENCVGEYKDGCYMDVCEFRLSACFWFWHFKEWKYGLLGLCQSIKAMIAMLEIKLRVSICMRFLWET